MWNPFAKQKARRVLLVCAPNIPPSEVAALEEHILEGMTDPAYTVIVNYQVSVQEVYVGYDSVLIITAPDVPPSEIGDLRKKFDDPARRLIVVNYQVAVMEF